jgi:hypothetical protein
LIKIRYTDLPAGLHVRAEASGRSTVIYLLPGLTHAERRAALLRARRSAGLGYGPRLPAAGVAAAVARDRVATTARNGVTAFRGHPLLLLPPLLIVASATLAYVMLSAVSVTFPPGVRDAQVPPARPAKSRSGRAVAGTAAGRSSQPASDPARRGSSARPRSPDPSPGQPGSGSAPADGPTGAPTTGAPTTGTSSAGPTSAPPSSPASPSAPASLSPSPAPSSTCVSLGLLGICLK